MRPSGVARLVRLCTVLLTIVTCGTWQTDRSIPPAIPRMIGLVRIPFTVSFARFPAAFFSPSGFIKSKMITARILLNGTFPISIREAISDFP